MRLGAWIAWTVAIAVPSACLAQGASDDGTVLDFRSVAPSASVVSRPQPFRPAAPAASQSRRAATNVMSSIQVGMPQPIHRFATEESQDEPGQPPRPAPVTPPPVGGEVPPQPPQSIPPQAPLYPTQILPAEGSYIVPNWTIPRHPVPVRNTYWVGAEYWLGWIEGMQLPALATTSPAGTPRETVGRLGESTTQYLVAGSAANQPRSGFKIDAGFWFPSNDQLGLEAGFSTLSSQSSIYALSSDGSTILARPFFDKTNAAQQAVLVAFPGVSAGRIDVQAQSGNFYESHIDLVERTIDSGTFRAESIIGYRFYRYDERLFIQQTVLPGAPFATGTAISSFDDFKTRNEFHGLDLGLRYKFLVRDDFNLGLLAKVAVGRVNRDISILGAQQTFVPGQPLATDQGGVLALASNIGHQAKSDWAVLPEFGLTLGYNVRPNLRFNVGYTLFLMQGISRAADQVDININPNLLPPSLGVGPAFPAAFTKRDDVWIQTVRVGFEYDF